MSGQQDVWIVCWLAGVEERGEWEKEEQRLVGSQQETSGGSGQPAVSSEGK